MLGSGRSPRRCPSVVTVNAVTGSTTVTVTVAVAVAVPFSSGRTGRQVSRMVGRIRWRWWWIVRRRRMLWQMRGGRSRRRTPAARTILLVGNSLGIVAAALVRGR